MLSISSSLIIREMTPEEIEAYSAEIYNTPVHMLTDEQLKELKVCADNYFQMTGRPLVGPAVREVMY